MARKIENSNIDRSYLNRGKLHLNRKGTVAIAKNLYRFVRSLPLGWIINGREGAFIRDEDKSLDNHSEISEMKSLRLKSPKNIFFSYLNINSVWNKFKNMSSLISGKCWHFDSGRDDITPALSKEFLDNQALIECGFTLKRVRDIIITYSQICHSKWKK